MQTHESPLQAFSGEVQWNELFARLLSPQAYNVWRQTVDAHRSRKLSKEHRFLRYAVRFGQTQSTPPQHLKSGHPSPFDLKRWPSMRTTQEALFQKILAPFSMVGLV